MTTTTETDTVMTVDAFYGRENGLRLNGAPYLAVCREQGAPPEALGFSTDFQPNTNTREDGRTTAEVMAEIAHRWNAHPALLAALEAVTLHDDHEDCRFCGTTEGGPHDPGATCSLILAAIRAGRGEE